MTDIPNDPAEGNLGGQSVQPYSVVAAKTPLTIDLDPVRRKMKDFFKEMHTMAEGFIKDMNAMGEALGDVGQAGSRSRGKAGGGGTPAPPRFEDKTTGAARDVGVAASRGISAMGGGSGINTGGAFGGLRAFANRARSVTGLPVGPAAVGLGLAGAAIGQGVAAIDTRIARGAEYASGADKLSVLTQQIYNLSQRQVIDQMRRPLTNYRLGAGGINQLLAFQASTGMAATPRLASSIAGISAATGYSKGTGDILADQQALLNPDVANRMFFQLGVNAYTSGGKMRDPLQLRQQLVQRLGLNNSLVLRGASAPGSITRARMTQAGVPQEMADDLIQYAKENQTFRQRGGRGNYDPSKPEDRKRMGIEGNLATQQQETERLRTQREEQFMGKQIDNMTVAEKQNQRIIEILGSIENKLSGPIGARAGGAGLQRLIGRGLQVGGLVTAAALSETGVGVPLGLGISALGTAMVGDPVAGDSTISVPTYGKAIPLDSLKNRSDFKQLNPKMQDSLLRMFRANPRVGLGQGARSAADQEKMFRSRYRQTSKPTNIQWQGSYWEHVSGAPAAPPGSSMHEIGLAADLVGDMGWVTAHAGEFGLKNFASVNNEPWHVQLSNLPNSRREYEKGMGVAGAATPTAAGTAVPDVLGDSAGGVTSGSGGGGSISTYAGMSISEIIEAKHFETLGQLTGGTGPGPNAGPPSSSRLPVTISAGTAAGGALSNEDIARLAFNAGFRGDDLIKMVAIANRESHRNPRAYNGNESTGDHSYGLWQLNTLNSAKGGNMGDLVNSLLGLPKGNTNFDVLFDPATNARVAYAFYQRNNNTLRPWGGYKGVSDTHGADQYITDATAAVKAAGISGDPMPMETRPTSSVHVSNGPSINFAPTINFYGVPQTPDLTRIAGEVGRQLKEQVRTLELRDA